MLVPAQSIFFLGLLLSLSFCPLTTPHFWHKHEKKIILFWGIGCIFSLNYTFGLSKSFNLLADMLLHEYIPFIVLVCAIFTINSGLHINLNMKASPVKNVLVLTVASLFSSIIGTTGASMLFLRPLIRMNHERKYKTHNIIFFIFSVANIGGSLTPLGDPPLFIGFLNGVDFFWPTKHLFMPFLITIIILLLTYFLIDKYLWKKEIIPLEKAKSINISIEGKKSFIFIFLMIILIPFSSHLSSKIIHFGAQEVLLSNILRDALLIILSIASYFLTKQEIRHKNHFSFAPLSEVSILFLAIFTTMIPITFIINAGASSSLRLSSASSYFWISGILSAFLDNAPTYLVFFTLAGGNAQSLMQSVSTLQAISLGTVFFGAMTYIGNTPNFIIRSIAKQSQITMPSFIGYLGWSCIILLPIFFIISMIFF